MTVFGRRVIERHGSGQASSSRGTQRWIGRCNERSARAAGTDYVKMTPASVLSRESHGRRRATADREGWEDVAATYTSVVPDYPSRPLPRFLKVRQALPRDR